MVFNSHIAPPAPPPRFCKIVHLFVKKLYFWGQGEGRNKVINFTETIRPSFKDVEIFALPFKNGTYFLC
jgi:hypothetical protein